MSVLELDFITLQEVMKKELELKDQALIVHEKWLELVGIKLDFFAEDLKERDRIVTEELAKTRKEFADEVRGLRKLIEQQRSRQPTSENGSRDPVGDTDSSMITPSAALSTNGTPLIVAAENSDFASLRKGFVREVDTVIDCLSKARRTVVSIDQKLTEGDDLAAGSGEEDLIARLKSSDEMLSNLQTELASKQKELLEQVQLVADKNEELGKLKTKSSEKDEKLVILNELLKLTQAKLDHKEEQLKKDKLDQKEEQLKQMQDLANMVLQQHQLKAEQMNDRKNDTASATEIVPTVTESMEKVMSSWSEMIVNQIKQFRQAVDESTVPSADLPDHLKRLQQLYPQMIEKLSARAVAGRLFQNDVLSFTELEKVLFSSTLAEAAEHLLDHLLSKQSQQSYDCFLRALKETNQEHLFLWLTYSDYNIDSQHTDLIRHNFTFLLDHLNPKESGLLTHLFQKKIIDMGEKEFIETGESVMRHAEKLLVVLNGKSSDQFEQFLVALDQTEHQHVAKVLRSGLTSTGSMTTNRANLQNDEPLGLEDPSQFTMPSLKQAPKSGTAATIKRTALRHLRSTSMIDSIAHVIPAIEGRTGHVGGLALHGSEIFIVRSPTCRRIEVYDATNYTFQRFIQINKLGYVVRGLASCSTNNCLYVSDWSSEVIHRVELGGNDNVIKWGVRGEPRGLSVNSRHNLLVVCKRQPSHEIIEYTTDGQLVREILLHEDVIGPKHAVQLKSGQFLVSQSSSDRGALHRICLVDVDGRRLSSYGGRFGPTLGELNKPRHLAVDETNKLIFVADRVNSRIVVLNVDTLTWLRYLELSVKHPNALFFDERRSRLFVGEFAGQDSRVLVINI